MHALFGCVCSCSFVIYTGSKYGKVGSALWRKIKFAMNHYTEVAVQDTTCSVSGLKSALKLRNVEDGSSNLESSSSLQENDHGS